MKRGLRTETDVVRLFREHGFVVLTIRRRKHWIVHARRKGSEIITRYVLSPSPSDVNTVRIIKADFRRNERTFAQSINPRGVGMPAA